MFKWLKRLMWFFLLLSSLGIAAVAAFYFHLEKDLPDVSTLKDTTWETPLRVYSADGKLMSEFGDVRRIPLQLDQIPLQMQQAFLAIEDSRFYEHPGIDFIGIARAAVVWAVSGDMKQGASTITQQVARNFFLSREKTILRKVKEVFLAWRIERELTKGQILELYLNKIPLGYRAYGVGAAAQVYYGKSVSELTLGEMAVIAGLPKAPSMLNPIRSPQRAMNRRNLVLGRMLQLGIITQSQHDAAVAEPIVTHYHRIDIGLDAPYIAEMVRRFMVEKYGEESYSKGYHVYTTINSLQQQAADNAVFKGLVDYDIRHGYRGPEKSLWKGNVVWNSDQITNYLNDVPNYDPFEPAIVTAVRNKDVDVIVKGGLDATIPWDGLKWARPFINDDRQGAAPRKASDILKPGDQIWVWQDDSSDSLRLTQIPDANAAFIALNPRNGAIQALVGGFNFQISKFNRVEQARRQVGSNIKPFIYSSALANGFTLASLVNDAPITQWDGGTSGWSPKNSPPRYDGPIPVREALARSKNVVTVRLLRSVGIDNVLDYLRRFGFPDSSLQRNESISLGTAELTPMELVTGYATFANGGFKVTPFFIDRIEDSNGGIVYEAQPQIACDGCGKLAETGLNNYSAYAEELGEWHSQCPIDPVVPNEQAPRIITEANSFLIREALHSAVYGGSDRGLGNWMGTGWRAAKELKRKDLAGKTGTTNEAKDAWFSGFAPTVVATAWVGFDDHRRALGRSIAGNEFGASAAQPIWIEYMKVALKDIPQRDLVPPDDIVTKQVNSYSGLTVVAGTPGSRDEYFEKGTEPLSIDQEESVLFDNGQQEVPAVQPTTPQPIDPTVPHAVEPVAPVNNSSSGTDDLF